MGNQCICCAARITGGVGGPCGDGAAEAYCAKSLQGEASCGNAVHGRWMKCPLPPPPPQTPLPQPPPSTPLPLPQPSSPCWTPLPLPDSPSPHGTPSPCQTPPVACMTCGRQGGQGRIDDITGKGLRTAVALSTASCCVPAPRAAFSPEIKNPGSTGAFLRTTGGWGQNASARPLPITVL